jgi:hypothetical protein
MSADSEHRPLLLPRVVRPALLRVAYELRPISGCTVPEVFDGFRPGALVPIYDYASLCPPERLFKVFGLLLADRHLAVRLHDGNMAPSSYESLPHVAHLGVVLATHLIVFIERT